MCKLDMGAIVGPRLKPLLLPFSTAARDIYHDIYIAGRRFIRHVAAVDEQRRRLGILRAPRDECLQARPNFGAPISGAQRSRSLFHRTGMDPRGEQTMLRERWNRHLMN